MKNPLLDDAEASALFSDLSDESKIEIKRFCDWLYKHSRNKAEQCWRSSKAPMAVYWKAVAAWSYHIKRHIKLR